MRMREWKDQWGLNSYGSNVSNFARLLAIPTYNSRLRRRYLAYQLNLAAYQARHQLRCCMVDRGSDVRQSWVLCTGRWQDLYLGCRGALEDLEAEAGHWSIECARCSPDGYADRGAARKPSSLCVLWCSVVK